MDLFCVVCVFCGSAARGALPRHRVSVRGGCFVLSIEVEGELDPGQASRHDDRRDGA
jgi:hypothetical protein